MTIPKTVPQTEAGYTDYLHDTVNLADKMWSHYGWVFSSAYSTAYKRHQTTLGKVKNAIEKQKRDDFGRMSFALSLLTVGVGGATAGAIARFMYESKNIQDGVKKVVDKALPTNALVDALSPDKTVADVFAPSDSTPEEYTSNLFSGISDDVALLTEIAYAVKYGAKKKITYVGVTLVPGTQLSVDELRKLTEAISDSSFIKEMPEREQDEVNLTKRAHLALWIGWALARDKNYWGDAPVTNTNEYYGKGPIRNDDFNSVGESFWEQFQWEPARKDLLILGVPPSMITAKGVVQKVGWGGGGWEEIPGLYMPGFIKWAKSPLALDLLFSSLPTNARGLVKVKDQWRKVLGTP
jgi:hypothetical protein